MALTFSLISLHMDVNFCFPVLCKAQARGGRSSLSCTSFPTLLSPPLRLPLTLEELKMTHSAPEWSTLGGERAGSGARQTGQMSQERGFWGSGGGRLGEGSRKEEQWVSLGVPLSRGRQRAFQCSQAQTLTLQHSAASAQFQLLCSLLIAGQRRRVETRAVSLQPLWKDEGGLMEEGREGGRKAQGWVYSD